MRVLYWLAILLAALFGGVFAISNRGTVSLAFWPVPFVATLPLYLLVFAALLVGFVAGVVAAWIGARHRRRQLRASRRRIDVLESELQAARSRRGD